MSKFRSRFGNGRRGFLASTEDELVREVKVR